MADSIDEKLYGTDLFGESLRPKVDGVVVRQYLQPPFSVLNARNGDWQDRKRAWIATGIESELGREGGECIHMPNSKRVAYAGNVAAFDSIVVKSGTRETTDAQYVSIFDPVLCELMYTWFTGEGHVIVDPFAGGSVRGIVAGSLKRRYWGCDLRLEQVEENQKQKLDIIPYADVEWVCGDALDVLESSPEADFIFSCPPYGDLEVYSDDPRDLSNMEYHTFIANYKRIIHRACKKLRHNRFACFVVGDFRDKKGYMRDFVSSTIQAFKEQGLELYNEIMLVTSVGSASMRVTKQFDAGRKVCKTHQNVLVFVKGGGKEATNACKSVG